MGLPITIYRGGSKTIDVYFRDEDDIPIDLTSMTEIEADFPPATGSTPIKIKFTDTEVVVVGNAILGHAQLQISSAKSALFALTNYDATDNPDYTTLTLKLTITGNAAFDPGITDVDQALNIVDP